MIALLRVLSLLLVPWRGEADAIGGGGPLDPGRVPAASCAHTPPFRTDAAAARTHPRNGGSPARERARGGKTAPPGTVAQVAPTTIVTTKAEEDWFDQVPAMIVTCTGTTWDLPMMFFTSIGTTLDLPTTIETTMADVSPTTIGTTIAEVVPTTIRTTISELTGLRDAAKMFFGKKKWQILFSAKHFLPFFLPDFFLPEKVFFAGMFFSKKMPKNSFCQQKCQNKIARKTFCQKKSKNMKSVLLEKLGTQQPSCPSACWAGFGGC